MRTKPSIEAFHPRTLGNKSWGTELLVAETEYYIGKVLLMDAGKAGNFQHHERKDETFYLFSGYADVEYDDNGRRTKTRMVPGQSFHVPPGAAHGVTAVTDCVFFEASTPVFDDRVVHEQRATHT